MLKVVPQGHIEEILTQGIGVKIPTPGYGQDNDEAHERWLWLEERLPRQDWLVSYHSFGGKSYKLYTFAPDCQDVALLFKLTWGGM